MTQEERRERVSYPGDKSKLLSPGLSGVNIDYPQEVVVKNSSKIELISNAADVAKKMRQKDMVVNRSQAQVTGNSGHGRSTIVSNLAGYTRPVRGFESTSSEGYRAPELRVHARGNGRLIVEAGKKRHEVPSGQSIEKERSVKDVELTLRTRDGTPTTETVPVTPKIQAQNLGEVEVTERGEGNE